MKRKVNIGIAGNPNSGKTTLFNALTGMRHKVGNWPGVTVERKSGKYEYHDKEVIIVDLPGIYSLTTASIDEKIARDYILVAECELIVNIIDASNIERSLYLTTQLIEMKVPVVVVLNMMDRVRQRKITIDVETMSRLLDCPVVCTVANKNYGITVLRETIDQILESRHTSDARIYFPDEVEDALKKITPHIPAETHYPERWLATKLLEGDIDEQAVLTNAAATALIQSARHSIKDIFGEEVHILMAESRYGFINSVCKKVLDKSALVRKNISDFIDQFVLNKFLGVPLFFVAMYLTFWVTINFGGCFIDFFDQFFGALCVDGFREVFQYIGVPLFLQVLLADGVGGGLQLVSTFIPPIFFMFLCLALLEDSGYMARAAFVMDRLMRAIGLPGKAFLPLLLGFGCNVPAIMATRTLEQERERVLTIVINPFISCGARLPVYALFATAFFPRTGGIVIFSLYMIGILLAIGTAFLLRRTLLKGTTSAFIMELPPYHIPTIRGVFIHTWDRLKAFILRAGQAIIIVVVFLSIISSFGTDGSFSHQAREQSILSVIGKKIVPIFKPMGLREDNWPAAVGIFTGILHKEAVIGTLNALYAQVDVEERRAQAEPFDFAQRVQNAVSSIGENIRQLSLPFALSELFTADVAAPLEEFAVTRSTYASLREYFDGRVGAYAYLLMILLYMPCVAAIAAVYRELNLGWTIFSICYLSGLAWLTSTLFYQIGRFAQHPGVSSFWIGFCVAVLGVFVFILKRRGEVQRI